LVFVTAASDSYVRPVVDAVALVQKFFPGAPIYLYDLSDAALENAHQVPVCHRLRSAVLSRTRSTIIETFETATKAG